MRSVFAIGTYTASAWSLLGDREEQQDAFCLVRRRGALFAAVCDGIGGLPGGALASRSAVEALQDAWLENLNAAPAHFYRQAVDWMDRAVVEKSLGGGSTVVSVWLQDGRLFWLSIGDSGLYLLRGGQLRRLAEAHTYASYLQSALAQGSITQEAYAREMKNGRALTSYLGMNGVRQYAQNPQSAVLERGDMVLLCSDGLTQAVPEERLAALLNTKRSVRSLSELLRRAVLAHTGGRQDNATLVLVRYR